MTSAAVPVAVATGLRQWLVDAFTRDPFGGNAAMVVEPLDRWPTQVWMQRLAAENNVAATAFIVRGERPSRFQIRWFTPSTEVPLCGHATLAAAHVLYSELGQSTKAINFETASGRLSVQPNGAAYEMELPALPAQRLTNPPEALIAALGCTPLQVWLGHYVVAILEGPEDVLCLEPDLERLKAVSLALGGQGNVGVAAVGGAPAHFDVVDRFFAPGYGIPEDAATGSFHAMLAPIIADQLKRMELRCWQAYPTRGARIGARINGDTVVLRGEGVTMGQMILRAGPQWPLGDPRVLGEPRETDQPVAAG